ncbi:MAG TPA: hypothetical protein PLW68_14490 [Casimicrobiaceae bacterium]|nr:hypothetical protein [Casimicrobiaceae bacterium]
MSKKLVLLFYGSGANDAIRGLMNEYSDALTSIGMSIVTIEAQEGEWRHAVDLISQGKVGFAVTWVGIGQDIAVTVGPERTTTNLWEQFRIPLLKLHGDLPAYYSSRHGDTPSTSVNLYHAQEFAHFRRRWMPEMRALSAVLPPLPLSPADRGTLDLSKRRSGKIVFLKNGNSPLELRRLWNERLPHSIAALVGALADEITPVALKPGLLHIGDFVGDFLSSNRIDPDTMRDMVLFMTAQADDYLRRIKSQMIAEAILDLPVIIQGGHWDHVDFGNRKAQRVDGQDFAATNRVYADQLGIIDMSPNVDTWPHDRAQRAAGHFSTLLTNRQGWIAEGFPGFDELTFEFNPESIRDRVNDAIGHPDRYLELGVGFGDRFRELHTRDAFANRIVDMAELAAFRCGTERPMIQSFFEWPRR